LCSVQVVWEAPRHIISLNAGYASWNWIGIG